MSTCFMSEDGTIRVQVITLTMSSKAKTHYRTCGDGQQFKVEQRAVNGGWLIVGYFKTIAEVGQVIDISTLREFDTAR